MSEVTIHLTEEQQKQLKNATGKDMAELNLSFESQGQLTDSELSGVTGGGVFRFTNVRANATAYIGSTSTATITSTTSE